MSIAITDDHRTLAQTVSDFLRARGAREASRALLDAETEQLPAFWAELGNLGWLKLEEGDLGGARSFLEEAVAQYQRRSD